jgi:hypothetical protein
VASPRPTEREFPRADATPGELRAQLIRIADELRLLRIGNQPDRIEHIVSLMAEPRLRGVLAQIGHPKTWVTPKGAEWMAEHLMKGAGIMAEMMADSEITGSERVLERAREWLAELGILDSR